MSSQAAPASATVSGSWARWLVVVGALMIQMILGTVYAFSVFVEPFEQLFGWTRTQITTTGSITLAVFALTMIFAGILQDERGPRFTALWSAGFLGIAFIAASQMGTLLGIYIIHGMVTIGAILLLIQLVRLFEGNRQSQLGDSLRQAIVGGTAVTSLLVAQKFITGGPSDSLWMLYLTYGLIGGAGIGLGYVSPIAACVKWFPYHRGLITGVAVAGFGAGSLIFAPSAQWTMERVGLSTFFWIHGLVCMSGLTIGGLLLRNPPPGYEAPQRRSQKQAQPRTRPVPRYGELPWEEVVRKWAFWRLWLMFTFAATAGLMTMSQLKPFATLNSLTPDEGIAMIQVFAVFNAAGRVGWGAISDRIGREWAMSLMFVLQAAMMVIVNGLSGVAGLWLAASWIGFNFGGIFALFPSATADAFGTKGLGTNYGFVFTAYGVAGIMGPIVGARVYDATGQYTAAFLFAGVLCIVAAAIAFGGRTRTART
ncbi:OFA family MFS transporter [Candidatus Poribacteria bacterium]|nr:OFA family MFS transporter [Candidatus Poribacteria bacterium]